MWFDLELRACADTILEYRIHQADEAMLTSLDCV